MTTEEREEIRRICEAAAQSHLRQTEDFTHIMTVERWTLIKHALAMLPAALDALDAAEQRITELEAEVERLRAGLPEAALDAARQLDTRHGGMASIHLSYNPYWCRWVAWADWSSSMKVMATRNTSAASLEALTAMLAAEAAIQSEKGKS